jgi:hypothetical protein
MKPILIIRIPIEAEVNYKLIREYWAKKFKQYKVTVIYHKDLKPGLHFSVINTTLKSDEIVEKEVLKLISTSDIVFNLLKARLKNFFYFGKWVD